MQHALMGQLRQVADSRRDSAFVRLSAADAIEQATRRATDKWVWLDELPIDEQHRLLELHEARQQQDREEQAMLHDAFRQFAPESRLYRIAADACAAIEQGDLGRVITLDGREANLHAADRQGTLDLSKHDADLLKAAHTPAILDTIALESGLDMRTLPLQTQLAFFRFMAEARGERYERLCGRLTAVGAPERRVLAEAFLATKFGDALGESILAIAERDDNERAFEVFWRITEIRQNVAMWGEAAWFAQEESAYKGYFDGIKEATEMRISQILSPVPDLMDGVPQQAQYFHRDGSVAEAVSIESVDQVLQGLKLLEFATRNIAKAEVVPQSARKPIRGDDYWATLAATDETTVRTTMRSHENGEAEARIRWAVEVSPERQLEIFGEHLERNKLDQPRTVRVSLHLDFEKISKKPSFDFGTRMEHGSSRRGYPDRLLAALVTAGVQHDLARTGGDILHRDYHVRDVFEPEMSSPQHFTEFVTAAHEHYISADKLLGGAGIRLSELAATSEVERVNAVYTGLFLDEAATAQLRSRWPATLTNLPQSPHVTIRFRPKTLEGFTPGEQHIVRAMGIIDNGRAQALVIDPSEVTQGVMNPHITLSTGFDDKGKKIAPDYSKQAIKEAKESQGIKWFDEPVDIPVVSGYLDGRTGQVVTHI